MTSYPGGPRRARSTSGRSPPARSSGVSGSGRRGSMRPFSLPTARSWPRRLADKTIRLWDLATGREIRQFGGANVETRHLAFSPDGTKLASTETTMDGPCLLLGGPPHHADPHLGHGHGPRAPPAGRRTTAVDVCFSPDGTTLASVGRQVIRFWEVASGRGDPAAVGGPSLSDWGCGLHARWSIHRDGRARPDHPLLGP